MIAVNSPAAEADADVVERGDGGVAGAVELADALGAGRGGGRRRCGVRGGGDGSWWCLLWSGRRPVGAACHQDTAIRGPPPIGLGARRRGRCPRGSGGRSCGQPHPRGSGQAPPARRREGADCRHDAGCGRLRRRSRRELLGRRCWCWPAWSAFVVARVRRGGARRRRADRPHLARPSVALSVLATAVVALGVRPGADPARARSRRALVHGGQPSPYDVLQPVLRDRHRQLRRRGAARADGPGARRRAPAPSGPRCGWSVGDRPTLAATWPPGRDPAPATAGPTRRDAPGRRALPVRHGGELLGVLGRPGARPACR